MSSLRSRFFIFLGWGVFCFALVHPSFSAPTAETPDQPEGTEFVTVLLLGDSTVQGSVNRTLDPDVDQLEDIVCKLLDAEPDLPPVRVINQGRGGEYVQQFLNERYDKVIEDIQAADYITIRYGLNDYGKRENFMDTFKGDIVDLVNRLKKDNPEAEIIVETVCVYFDEKKSEEVNSRVKAAAEEAGVPLLDIYARNAKEIEEGNTILSYRRVPLERIPENLRSLLPPLWEKDQVVVMDNRLDAHFKNVEGWFSDKHPNHAGYHIIGSEEARYLAPRIRERSK